jgi:hypothetical protein
MTFRFAMKCPARLRVGLVSVSLLVTAACSSSNAPEPSTSGGASGGGGTANGGKSNADGGKSSSLPLHGGITIELHAPEDTETDGYSTAVARFFDAATPPVLQLELAQEQAECQLLKPSAPFCSEPCAPAICTADDTCTPYPNPVSVGVLTLSGLGDELALEPASAMQVYQAPSLPNPPCPAGSRVTAMANGLSLAAECIEQLELTGPDPILVASGRAVEVRWTPAKGTKASRIRIRLDIAHHGGKKGEITCEVPDNGSFDIPESLVTELIALGLAGYPDISVTRVSVGVDTNHPDAELLLSSNVLRAVDTGVKSCQDDSQCPGQTCLDTRVCG